MPPPLPTLHLLTMDPRFSSSFAEAVSTHFPDLASKTPSLTTHNCALKSLPGDLRFDAVVSPANSYGRLDGAFDDALARAYGGPRREYDWLTRKAQAELYRRWKGFAPPGTCTVVRMDWGDGDGGEKGEEGGNAWGTEYLLICPTMRVPQEVRWDREVVYECVWSMLCAVEGHNRGVRERAGRGEGSEGEREIGSVLMTPLATGVGRVGPTRWAEQAVLAMKHWVEAVERPDVWGRLDWNTIEERHDEVAATYAGDVGARG